MGGSGTSLHFDARSEVQGLHVEEALELGLAGEAAGTPRENGAGGARRFRCCQGQSLDSISDRLLAEVEDQPSFHLSLLHLVNGLVDLL
jgi:hypothetical protein